MSNPESSRKFQPGPGLFLFFGIIGLVAFSKNSHEVVKTMMERVKVQAQRMSTEYDGLRSTMKKKQEEGK